MVAADSARMWPLLLALGFPALGGDLRLLEALKNKDKTSIATLLKQHVDVNAAQGDGATALSWAVHWDQLENVDLLIRAGANVNAADDLGATSLSLACENRSAAMVEKLLTAGANAKAAQKTGETVLMTCARTGTVAAVQALVGRGADVNARESRMEQTALMWSAAEKHPEVTRILIDHRADVRARSKSGFSALFYAARSGDVESAQMLVDAGANVNDAAHDGMTPLLLASASGHEAISIFLLDKGANPNIAIFNGITPLHYALQKGISALRGAGSDEPFTYAYWYRPHMGELVSSLLAHKADPNARMVNNPSELEGSNHISWVGGVTPLILAAATLDVGYMKMLLAAGADPRARAGNGMTALMLAAGFGADQKYGGISSNAKVTAESEAAALAGVKLMSDAGSEIGATDNEGDTALHLAAEKGSVAVVKFLLEKGADVNLADKEGQTPLHRAAFKGSDAIVQMLADKGATVNVKDANGQTPLDIAEGLLQPGQLAKGQVSILILLQTKKVNKSTADLLRSLGGEHGDPTTPDSNNPTAAIPATKQ